MEEHVKKLMGRGCDGMEEKGAWRGCKSKRTGGEGVRYCQIGCQPKNGSALRM